MAFLRPCGIFHGCNDHPGEKTMPELTPHSDLRRLDVLVGRWNWTGHAKGGGFDVTGWAEYQWLEGRHFLVERSALTAQGETNHNLAVTGYDVARKTCIARYFDSAGLHGEFRLAVDGDRLLVDWDRYRLAADISPDRSRISGEWQSSEDGAVWAYWYDMVMERQS